MGHLETNTRQSKGCPKFVHFLPSSGLGRPLGTRGGRTPRASGLLLHHQLRQPGRLPSKKTARLGTKARPSAALSTPTALLSEWNTLQTRLFPRDQRSGKQRLVGIASQCPRNDRWRVQMISLESASGCAFTSSKLRYWPRLLPGWALSSFGRPSGQVACRSEN